MVIAVVNHYQIPGTCSLNHFACPSASYHAIQCLCITLMLIVLFWRFSTQKLQVWKLATIVDFATYFTSSTFVLTTLLRALVISFLEWGRYSQFHFSDLYLDWTFAKMTRIHKICQGKFFTYALIKLPTAEAYRTISISHWFLKH